MAFAGGIPSPDIVPGWFADISDWSANWFPARMVCFGSSWGFCCDLGGSRPSFNKQSLGDTQELSGL